MKHSVDDTSVDLDQLTRIFTWLATTLVVFALGMVFELAIIHDLEASSSSTTSSTVDSPSATGY